LGAAGAAVAAGTAQFAAAEGQPAAATPGTIKIVGVACSFRKGKTTAAAVQACLDAAKAVSPEKIEIELVDLGGLRINGAVAAGIALEPGERDDFPQVAARLSGPNVAGVIVGTPTYFSNMSSLCKAFLERLMLFRKNDFALSNKVAGVVAVGAARNGGQELAIQAVKAALVSQEMIVVGEGRPTAHGGPVFQNQGDDISKDEVGLGAAKNLGRRVAEVALIVTRCA